MSFMDNLKNQAASALGNLAAGQGGLAGSAMAMINAHPGGLAGLVQQFQQNGLGPVVASWISTGPNQPISPAQIQQVLGNERLQAFAAQHGIDVNQVSTQLSTILPGLIDKLTPTGTLPATGAAPAAPTS